MNFCNKSHDIRSKDYNTVKSYVHKKLIKAAFHYRIQQKQVKDVQKFLTGYKNIKDVDMFWKKYKEEQEYEETLE